MKLTDKVHYLLTEYNETLRPRILEITSYISIIKNLPPDEQLLGTDFDNLSDVEKAVVLAELIASRHQILPRLKNRIKILGQEIVVRADRLLLAQKDHVVDMSTNVDDDAEIGKLTAQVEALKTTIQGMNAIIPGGGAGAAIVVIQNAPTILDLGEKVQEKAEQVVEAEQEVIQLGLAAVELANFVNLLPELN